MKLAAACAAAARIRALARDGVDWPATEEARLRVEAAAREQAERKDGLTLAKALREYVEKKRRAKDGLPLKAYTRPETWPCSSPAELRRLARSLPMANCMPLRTSCSPRSRPTTSELYMRRC